MSSQAFEIVALAPVAGAHAGVAIAAARAGGVGILDLEFCGDAARARTQFQRLLAVTQGAVGLHGVLPAQQALVSELVELAGERPLSLMLSGDAGAVSACAAQSRGKASHRILAVVTAADALAAFDSAVDGIVAKGHEAPGWVGEDSSYILVQKLLGRTALPVFVRGGVGLNTAAACRAAGAAGVVLDDQLLLLEESALPESMRAELSRLSGAETRLFGEALDVPCRVYARPVSPALKAAEADARAAEAGAADVRAWRQSLCARIGWDETSLLPVGQGIGLAAIYRDRYGRVGRLIQALRKHSFEQLRAAARLRHLSEDAPLARSHGTRYPLAQGPMTRVSDSPAFAAEVARGGALPFLALALMRGDAVLQMLQETQRLASGMPWGVGMLGFVPQALREEQCEAIWQCKPGFALIAGGRPDQAAEFEKRGIATYIHAPAPALLKLYLEQGARRFVFEGRECGGHIGPITSFPLWEQMIEVLLANVSPGTESDLHLLFAGGISDARSGAMLSALTAPLAARGMKIGALMGTAYLFTHEIVATGAVVPGFQKQAVACRRTVNVETGPGHATRCADTGFAKEFHEARRQLLRDNRAADEIRDALEDLNLGRLRVAAKGRDRDASGRMVEVAEAEQVARGMYMIGQVATLTDSILSIAELHRRVCTESEALLADAEQATLERIEQARPSDIAIIGIGALLPKAPDVQTYWDNILQQISAIGEVPAERWDWRLYYDADRNTPDRINSKWGGFMDEVLFDPIRYGIPPKSMKSIDPLQLLTLETVARAVEDAGLGDFDREHTSVILGASGGAGELGVQYALRSEIHRFTPELDPGVMSRLPEWTNESFAGVLLNVAAGRVANRLDFGGVNFTVDAACASSLAALAMAVSELESGRSNVAIAGGVDTVQNPYGFMCFAQTQALSPQGKPRAFDRKADGIVISEGVSMVVLKRLADAERDGDRVYAVIKAVAGSSDGKALGMTAPRPDGQIRALNRAYSKAGFSPATLGLLEAHGTGTAVGDKAEAETVTRVLREHGAAPKSVVLGSVKTLLGHTKACAGMAGLVKLALALHHRVLPAHANVDEPLDALAAADSPACLLKAPRPWLASPDGTPRRGAVSAFGFGGTNFHAVLEEYRDALGRGGIAGSAHWTQELIVLRAADGAALRAQVDGLLAALRQGEGVKLAELAYALAREADRLRDAKAVLAFATRSLASLATDLQTVAAHLAGGKPLPPHIKLSLDRPATAPKLAFVFPGQGAQYVGMGAESALFIEEIRAAVERADATLAGLLPERLSRRLWPESAYSDQVEAEQQQRLTDTRFAQPAIGTIELGYLALVRRLGIEAAAVAGHSYGEFAALHAAGVIDEDSFLRLSAVRGAVMAQAAATGVPGGMAAVQARREVIEAHLAPFAGVKIANHNAPEQSVISGPAQQIERAIAALSAAGARTTRLPVSGAFHTELMESARAPLSRAIAETAFAEPRVAVYSNGSGRRYPATPDAMRAQLDAHLLSSVEFVSEIEAMYADGLRLFLELGPRSVCSNMIAATLAGRDARACSLDGHGGGLRGLLTGLAELLTAGVDFRVTGLFEHRGLQAPALAGLAERMRPPPVASTAWYVCGSYARGADDPRRSAGAEPSLTVETSAQLKQALIQGIVEASPRPAAAPMALPAPAVAAAVSNEALVAYHETMRQFLALQERVITQFLGGGAALPAPPVPLAATAIPLAPPVAAAAVIPPALAPVAPLPAAVQAAPAVASIAAPAPPRLDAATVTAILLKLVAERTGYPEDMLGLEADLEADLGIDSIKRVEIVGALQKQLPADVAAAMQASMESFTRARTLKSIIDQLAGLLAQTAPESPAAAVAAAAPVAAAVVAAPVSTVDHRALLLAIVSERTGYPTDMLALDADLEADLGIDSIKRVEIVGALQKQLPADVAAAMQASMESFTRARTLAAVLERLGGLTPGAPAASAAPAVTAAPAAEPAVEEDVPRYVIRPRPAPLPAERVSLRGAVLVAGGRDGVVTPLLARLAEAGLGAVHIEAIDAIAIEAGIAAARAQHGEIAGVIHLHGLAEDEPQTLEAWRELGERTVLSLFRLLRPLGSELAKMRVIAATRLGGTFGRDAVGPGTPLAGGVVGLLNCVRDEYPSATLRAVDFNGQTDELIATLTVEELLAADRAPEAGHTGDARYSVATVEAGLIENPFAPGLRPAADWVVLATGGARGITAELLEEMAQPGISFVLVGRTPEPAPEAPELAAAGDAAALRQLLLAQARARGETPRPIDIERAAQRLLTDREIRGNLQRLRDKGANVGYFACDVRDPVAFGGIIDGIYQHYGRLDAVLHGAGVIEDKRIADKTDESFARVFGTKLNSSFILAQKLRPETLKLLVFFTSVAGRYGNRGQIDYAAANEAVNRLAWSLSRRWPETRVLAANWGPWDAGMASEGVKRQFRERGIEPIPVAGGRRYFLRELACGPKHEVEVVIGRGPWRSMEASDSAAAAAAVESLYPLVRAPLRMGAGGALVLTHEFGLQSDPYLADHVIDGKPVLPAAAAAEWIGQTVGQGWPGWQVAEVVDLRTLAGVVLEPGKTREVEIRARATSHSGPGEQTVVVDIADPARKAPLYRASVRLVEHLEAPALDVPAAIAGQRLDAHETYERMLFHTGRFRLLTEIGAVAPLGIDARVRSAPMHDWIGVKGDWLFDPGLIDVAAQLAWIWARVHRESSALPSRFGRVLRVPNLPRAQGPLQLRFRVKPAAHEQAIAYDAFFTDDTGRLRLAVLDGESTLSTALNRIGSQA